MARIKNLFVAVLGIIAFSPVVFAEGSADGPGGGFYFGVNESNLRRDLSQVRFYPMGGEGAQALDSISPDGIVYFGVGEAMFTSLWAPGQIYASAGDELVGPASWGQDVQFGMDWRPDITGGSGYDARRISRSLAGSEIERVGVRTDVTALIFDGRDESEPSTAWRISGGLGATSLSLIPGGSATEDILQGNNNLLWDVGVGWSSGAVSLNAGYLSTTRVVEGMEGDLAILSFGADYAVLPGLSVYGEFNVIDDPLEFGDERLGTVIILGTGLNF